jgi:hypothetical protein
VKADTWKERLAAWMLVFPAEQGVPLSPEADWMAALEGALEELRETRQPIPTTLRQDVITHAHALLGALGQYDRPLGQHDVEDRFEKHLENAGIPHQYWPAAKAVFRAAENEGEWPL